jgi:hypothetical protein
VPGGWFVAPGVVAGFAGLFAFGLESDVRPVGERAEFWPFGRFVLSLGRPDEGLSRASGGERAGKLMTCSRKGTE